MTWEEIRDDPSLLSFIVRNGQRLLRSNAIVNWFDPALEAEATGVRVNRGAFGIPQGVSLPVGGQLPSSGSLKQRDPVSHALEVAERLCQEVPEEVAVVGYLTGPSTLSYLLFGQPCQLGTDEFDYCVAVAAELARAYCESGVGGLLLAEDTLHPGSRLALGRLNLLVNIAQFYAVPVILCCRGGVGAEYSRVAKEAGIAYILRAWPAAESINTDAGEVPALGEEDWEGLASQNGPFPKEVRGMRWISTSWEIPASLDAETVLSARDHLGF